MRLGWLSLAVACRSAELSAPPTAPPQPPERPAPWLSSLDLDVLPAGPFHSAENYCERWKARQKKGVAQEEPRCRAEPEADGCSGYGPGSTCWVEPLAASAPFEEAQLLVLIPPGGPANCYLALTTARETWLVYEVRACAPSEGLDAVLSTKSLGTSGDTLVWTYVHEFDEYGEVQHKRNTVTCRRRALVPACDGLE